MAWYRSLWNVLSKQNVLSERVHFPPLSRIIRDSGKLRSELLTKADVELLKHTINMFLEVFGYCEIVDKDENPIGQKIKIKEVSWRILPPGKYPWERAEKALDDYLKSSG